MIGTATAYFANQRGRDPIVWFMVGMLLGLFGLVLLFLLPPVSAEEAAAKEMEDLAGESKPPEIKFPVAQHDYLIKEWFYYDQHKERQGPVKFEVLKKLWEDGNIDEETFVWAEGMANWVKIEEVQNLYAHLILKDDVKN